MVVATRSAAAEVGLREALERTYLEELSVGAQEASLPALFQERPLLT